VCVCVCVCVRVCVCLCVHECKCLCTDFLQGKKVKQVYQASQPGSDNFAGMDEITLQESRAELQRSALNSKNAPC